MEEIDSENSVDPERLQITQTESMREITTTVIQDDSSAYSESMKYLQEHGITMLPADDTTNILSSVMENGHSVVLTEAGKQVLNSTKPADSAAARNNFKQTIRENKIASVNMKKIITVTPEEFLAMTANCNVLKQANGGGKPVAKTYMKRIVMRKNKTVPISATVNIAKMRKVGPNLDVIEDMRRKLAEANKLVEEYKVRLKRKEAEAERYKQQLRLILDAQ